MAFGPAKQSNDNNHWDLLGKSPAILVVLGFIQKAARCKSNVVILGESGTGKELVARAIHRDSSRKDGPFNPVNCGAIPPTLAVSQLFGYMKGAFSGAVKDTKGFFELAHLGTLFLDEDADLPLDAQVALLRVIQEREVLPLMSLKPIAVDVRIIVATNKDLAELVSEGKFREDLYYRLKVLDVTLPPLRERGGDIGILVDHFVASASSEMDRPGATLSPRAEEAVLAYSWPGNVRELQSAIERAVALADGAEVQVEDLPIEVRENRAALIPKRLPGESEDGRERLAGGPHSGITRGPHEPRCLQRIEQDEIVNALEFYHGNQTKTATALRISRSTLRRKMPRLPSESR
jgi:DNA-binding NtrC family response regulator